MVHLVIELRLPIRRMGFVGKGMGPLTAAFTPAILNANGDNAWLKTPVRWLS
jgi:hypothetical protein